MRARALRDDAALETLALGVCGRELARESFGARPASRSSRSASASVRRVEAPGGVQPRRDPEGDVLRGRGLSRRDARLGEERAAGPERAPSRAPRAPRPRSSGSLPVERDEVGDRAETGGAEQRLARREAAFARRAIAWASFHAMPVAGELLVRVFAAGLPRVDDDRARGELGRARGGGRSR